MYSDACCNISLIDFMQIMNQEKVFSLSKWASVSLNSLFLQ